MPLRLRLTLLYSILMAVLLLIFGTAVFLLVNIRLLNQIDGSLSSVASDIIQVTRVDSFGELNFVTLPALDITANAYVQVWSRDGKLRSSSPAISMMSDPLDPAGMNAIIPVFHDNAIQGVHLRVLSVPLKVGERNIGVLQVAADLSVADATRRGLLNILIGASLIAILLAGVLSWVILSRAALALADHHRDRGPDQPRR